MMTRLNYTLPLAASLAFASCSGDDTAAADTGQADTSGGMGMTDTGPDSDTDPGDTVNPPTTGMESDTTEPDSTGGDPCDGVMCPEGEECVRGTGQCFPAATTGDICDEWGMGAYADCVDGDACEGNGAVCVAGQLEGEGVCTFSCEEVCDCPEAPSGGTARVACGTVTQGGSGECYLDCSGGELCPTGMVCLGNSLCVHTNADPLGPYDGCNPSEGFTCPAGVTCLSDNPAAPTVSSCTPQCDEVADCPEGPPDSTVSCDTVAKGSKQALCYLSCEGGATCPDEWSCIANFICLQDAPQPPPVTVGYGGCVPNDNCLEEETCYEPDVGGGSGSGSSSGSSGSGSSDSGGSSSDSGGSSSDSGGATPGPNTYNVCTQPDCANAGECPEPPDTGNAPAACGDIGSGGDTCYLDCSDGQTCPDQMTCLDENFCAFDACGVAVDDPSFEEASLAGSAWAQASMAFGTPLCDGPTCLNGMNAARTGDWWIWFGGTDESEIASVSQDVLIPVSATALSLWLVMPTATTASPELDYVAISVDGNEELRITAADQATYMADYTEVLVDLSAYADGGTHTILLDSSVEGTELTNIFVDDVTLVCG